ncbi:MAG: SCO family protein [Bacteroidetes bacterium]|nr:SCO family protein [Bacteroidota bacterium]
MKKILIPLCALAICIAVIWKWTLGFSSFTIFSYTLNAAGNIPRTFPDIALINQDGKVFHLTDKHNYVLVNFVYLDCPSVCHKVNNQIEQIYHQFDSRTVPSKLEFVTVSFDLEHDGINKIKKYRTYFGKNIDGWNFALPYNYTQSNFNSFLHNVGIWKYSVPETGIINHSIYLFLIGPDGKIVKVFDPARESNNTIAQQINSCLTKEAI